MAAPEFTPLPTPPSRTDPDTFSDRGDAFLGALPAFQTEGNALGAYTLAQAEAALAAAIAGNLSELDLSTLAGFVIGVNNAGDALEAVELVSDKKGVDVASASALILGTDGNYFDITGTTTITSIGTLSVGLAVTLHFDAALTLTHHATDLVLPNGQDITTYAGYEVTFREYASGAWRLVSDNASSFYREGTWTPVMTNAADDLLVTHSNQTGLYTRHGNRVTAECYVQASSLGAITGDVMVAGLPHAAKTLVSDFMVWPVNVPWASNLNAIGAGENLGGTLAEGATKMNLKIWETVSGTNNLKYTDCQAAVLFAMSVSYLTDDP